MSGVTHFFRAGEQVQMFCRIQDPAYSDAVTLRVDGDGSGEVVGYFYWATRVNGAWYYAVRRPDGEVVACHRGTDGRLYVEERTQYTPVNMDLLSRAMQSPTRKAKAGGDSIEFATDAEMDRAAADAAAYQAAHA